MKDQKTYLMAAVAVVIVGAVSFYGGIHYQKIRGGFGQENFSQARESAMFGGRNGSGKNSQGMRGGMMGNRPVNGEVISQDATSITVKMPDGSSKILIVSDKTVFNKQTEATKTDLKVGDTVTAFGTANSDGSITVENIAIGGMLFGKQKATLSPTPTASPSLEVK